MSLFDDDPPPAPVERPPLHYATVVTTMRPVCGAHGPATVLSGLVTCPDCQATQNNAVRRPPRPVIRRDGLCLACSSAATEGEWCAHHARVLAGSAASTNKETPQT